MSYIGELNQGLGINEGKASTLGGAAVGLLLGGPLGAALGAGAGYLLGRKGDKQKKLGKEVLRMKQDAEGRGNKLFIGEKPGQSDLSRRQEHLKRIENDLRKIPDNDPKAFKKWKRNFDARNY